MGEGKLGIHGCRGVEELRGGIMEGGGGFLLMDAPLGAPIVLCGVLGPLGGGSLGPPIGRLGLSPGGDPALAYGLAFLLSFPFPRLFPPEGDFP